MQVMEIVAHEKIKVISMRHDLVAAAVAMLVIAAERTVCCGNEKKNGGETCGYSLYHHCISTTISCRASAQQQRL
jgi:hypothetical protein